LKIGPNSASGIDEKPEEETQWKKFYAPVLKIKAVCHKCRACIHACPAKALKWGVGEIIVNLKECAEEWLRKGECIQCAAECHQGAILLEEYKIKGREIKKI
jgi:ferredoxin